MDLHGEAAAIQAELDRLTRESRAIDSSTAEQVMRDAIEAVRRCVALKQSFVSLDALTRAVELEGRAQRIVERCRAAGKKR